MPKIFYILILLLPFIIWDVSVWRMRAAGDRSESRREEILRHFTQDDIRTGREHVKKSNQLFPVYKALFYLFYGVLLFGAVAAGLESRLMDFTGGRWYLALIIFIGIVLLAQKAVFLPVSAYHEFVIQKEAGLSTITPGTWWLDIFKSFGINWVFISLVALPVLALIKKMPENWPWPAAAVIIAFSAFMIWIHPWVLDPIFNKFKPLEDERLEERIKEISSEAGLNLKSVYVVDASRRSKYLNAYFSGMGNSRRVVLYDTLVESCPPDEIISVIAHELGHWKHNHIMKGFMIEIVAVIAGLWALWWLLDSAWFRELFGMPYRSSLVLLVLLPFLISLTQVATSPFISAISRHFERQADMTALELTRDPEAFIGLEKRLVRTAKSDLLRPIPIQLFYGSHPLPEKRIRMAENYRESSNR